MKKIIIYTVLLVVLFACSKQESMPPASQDAQLKSSKNLTVTTFAAWVPSAIWAQARGDISEKGGGNSVVDRGFCYSLDPDPTLSDSVVHSGSGAGEYSQGLINLTPGTTYYVKAFGIKNNGDIYYGNDTSFTTLTLGLPTEGVGIVYDQDGNAYNTITLGTQVWMVENLRTTHYRNGDPIQNLTDDTEWSTTNEGAYCDYDNDPANSEIYGRLYNQRAVHATRNIAPAGWHVASRF